MTAINSHPEKPDSPPKHLHVGAINPFALVEAILGRKLDWSEAATARMLSSILQTDYDELFDMRFKSILYAGIRLNDREDKAEPIPAKDMHTLTESDLVTPDFSKVQKLRDLSHMGIKDLENMRVKNAFMSNGNLRLTLEPQTVGKTLCSSEMTSTFRELCTPFRVDKNEEWVPPNGTWTDIQGCYCQDATMFSNPVQGAIPNSWLVAAMMSVSWSDPSVIKHCSGSASSSSSNSYSNSYKDSDCSLSIKLYSKGGDKDAKTATVTVNCELPTNNSSSLLMYCRPSSMQYMYASSLHNWGGEIWPSLYEKAFAQWITSSSSDDMDRLWGSSSNHPDLTQLSHGDPVLAMAQLTDKEPQYFFTSSRKAQDLLGLVRTHCVNLRTIYPMVAWTHPTSSSSSSSSNTSLTPDSMSSSTDSFETLNKYRGCTLVANLPYSILGWAAPQERKQYIILRHPWGVTEPEGLTSYPGIVTAVDAGFWPPVELVDEQGVFAMETGAFRESFAGVGVAK